MTKKYLFLDFETRSECDLKTAGTHGYAKHPTTEVMCATFALDNEPVQIWLPDHGRPNYIEHLVHNGGYTIVGHNFLNFDMHIWEHVWKLKPLHPSQVIDTMTLCYAMGLPGGLDGAGEALGLSHKKDTKASRIMLQLCQPRSTNPTVWWCPTEFKEKYDVLYAYAMKDIEATRELFSRLKPLTDYENKVLALDYKINNTGVPIDSESVKKAILAVDLEQARLNHEIKTVSNGRIATAQAVSQISDYIQDKLNMEKKPTVNKENVGVLLKRNIPKDVRRVLEIRRDASRTSTAKLKAMIEAADPSDGRIRNAFQYCGANTGRWSGRRVQFQNLKRGVPPEQFFEALDEGCLPLIFADPIGAISQSMRAMVKAPKDSAFWGADFSAIEARGLAWLAGQEDVLEVFRGHGKIYEDAASKIYHKDISAISESERFIGKVSILSCGYGGGKNAFGRMAFNYGVDVPEEVAIQVVAEWRAANQNIVKYWRALENAAIKAVMNPGKTYRVGFAGRQVIYCKKGDFLWCKLPSGRNLCYPYPTLKTGMTPWGQEKDSLFYKSVNSLTRKWEYTKTHGGILSENVTQAICRDVLADTLLRLDAAHFKIVLHVHDSITVEMPAPYNGFELFQSIFKENPEWAVDLPLDAKFWRNDRFIG